MELFSQACNDFGITISTKRQRSCTSKRLKLPTPSPTPPSALGRLKVKVWEHRGLSLDTKLKVYEAAVLPSLLYGCETRTVYSRHVNQLNVSEPCSVLGGRTKSQTPKCSSDVRWRASTPS